MTNASTRVDAIVGMMRGITDAHDASRVVLTEATATAGEDVSRALRASARAREGLSAREMKAREELVCVVDNCDAVAARARAALVSEVTE